MTGCGQLPPPLTYAELARRIEQALGFRPALSTLRAAAAVEGRGAPRTRITAGLPAPLPKPDVGGRTVFDAGAVDRWLASHPRRRIRQEQLLLAAAARPDRGRAVTRARAAGLSWRHIAEALAQADGTTYSRQWAHQQFGQHTASSLRSAARSRSSTPSAHASLMSTQTDA